MRFDVDGSGEEAIQDAIDVLEFASDGLDKDFDVSLSVVEVEDTETDPTEQQDEEGGDDGQQQDILKAHVENEDQERIQAGTSYHSALRAVADVEQRSRGKTNGVSSNEAGDAADIKMTTLRPALKQLVDKGLLERHEVDEGRTKYRYSMTKWGEQMLSELQNG